MNQTNVCALLFCVASAGGGAILASPTQDSTPFPGQPTKARVWVQNEGRAEAVPMTLQGVAPDVGALSVQVAGTPTVRIDTGNVVLVREVRQRWEYRSLNVGPTEDPANALNAAGEDGWEVAGLMLPGRVGTTLVLKRPR